MAIAIYARKSSESEDRQVQSLEDQMKALRQIAERESLTIQECFVEAKSAKDPYMRPEFQRLVKKIQEGTIDGVLTWSMNRLSRNLVDGGLIAHLLQSGQLRFIRTPERTYLPEDNALLLSIENGMATSFIQDLRKNVKRGMQGKVERGWFPAKAPLGYINNAYTREIDIDTDRLILVRKAWEQLIQGGLTISDIFHELKAAGLTRRASNGTVTPLQQSALYQLFRNPFYAGIVVYKGKSYPGKHKPIVSALEFEQAQTKLGKVHKRKRKNELLYSGLFRCGVCGCAVVGEIKHKVNPRTGLDKIYKYYRCTGAKGCSKRAVTEDQVTESVLRSFDSISMPRSFQEWAEAECRRQADIDAESLGKSEALLREQIASLNARRDRLDLMRVDGEIDASEYLRLKQPFGVEAKELQAKLATVTTAESRLVEYLHQRFELAALANSYAAQPLTAQRSMLGSLGTEHSIIHGKIRIDVDPVLKEIATFRPLKTGSEWPKTGSVIAAIPLWYSLIKRIRKIARMHVLHKLSESNAEMS
ncbi:MAG TPA: recombinase family protein [Fimbriimonadaceae bacterium]|jgi:DNA invertase Pin-like site-specific DNA recombinase